MNTEQALPQQGTLAEVSLPRVLLALYAKRFGGSLRLERGRTQKTFLFREGAPIGSESTLPAERLGALLEEAGVLSRADRKRVDAYVEQKNCKEGTALLALELLEAKELFEALREQLRRRAVECFGWASGTFELSTAAVSSDEVHPFRADPLRLVQEGLQHHWALDRMLGSLQHNMDRYPRPTPQLASIARRLQLDATVERMLAGLYGGQSLGNIVGAAATSPGALAAFWVLDAAGGLAYSDQPARSESTDEGEEAEIEIEITGDASPVAEPASAEPPRVKPDAVQSSPNKQVLSSTAAEKMRAEVLQRLEMLDEIDYYALLEVPQDADAGVIKKAYFAAAKRYHPDAISRLGLRDIRTEAGAVFSRIAEAKEVLSDNSRRHEYDRVLAGGGEEQIDVTTLAQAETFYRKGEILIRMGDFRRALDYLKNAVDLYPDEAVYQSDLGWAYYKKAPSEVKPALEHLRRAAELDGNDTVVKFRLGVIERSL